MARAPKKPKAPKADRLIERDGTLCQKCSNTSCPRTCPVEAFAPRQSQAKIAKFLRAVAQYKETPSADTRATIVEYATAHCDHCRDILKRVHVNPTTTTGKCKAYWEELKATTFHTCVDCGGTRCVEADNVVSDADRAVLFAEGKVLVPTHHHLSDYVWWSRPGHGGVEGMELEQQVCVGRCKMCHTLQPTSAAGRRVDPSTLPPTYPGEQYDGEAGKKMYLKRWNATKNWPRYAYVDELKRAVGRCENLNCPRDGPGGGKCVAGVEQCFDWEHTRPKKKRANISELCCNLPVIPEAKWKGKINRELKRGDCKLLCKNCHHLKTWHGMVPRYARCESVKVDRRTERERQKKTCDAGSSADHAAGA
jgi:hypothetical protein